MDSNCKYFGSILLTFLLFSRAACHPVVKNESQCKTLSNLYPPNFNLNDTLNSCQRKELVDPTLRSYCTELFHVWNEISSCGLGRLLEEVSSTPQLYLKLLSTSQKVPMTENEDICKVFDKLNSSLYKVYLDEPGFGKRIAGPFCPLFCTKDGPSYCEMLLRTYWIKKVFQDFMEDAKKAKGKPDTSVLTTVPHTEKSTKNSGANPADPGTAKVSIPVSEVKETSKAEPNNHVSAVTDQTKNSPAVQKNPISESEPPGGVETHKEPDDKTKKLKSDKPFPTADENKPLEIHKTTLDTNLHSNSGPTSNTNNKKDPSTFDNVRKVNEVKPPNDSIKAKTEKNTVEDVNTKAKPVDSVNAASLAKTKPDLLDDTKETKVKPTVPLTSVSETKELPPPPIEPSENDKSEGNDNLDVPDKTMSDDMATNLEKDTEHGNQMRDFGDGYAVNEYPDVGSPDESEIPLPGESAQTATKDDNKKLPSDETNVGKQTHNVPQLSAFPDEEGGHFFAYFLTIIVFCIAGYLVFHNKQKIIALIIEGRHERRRRPNNGTYKRLDSKDGAKATSHVIF